MTKNHTSSVECGFRSGYSKTSGRGGPDVCLPYRLRTKEATASREAVCKPDKLQSRPLGEGRDQWQEGTCPEEGEGDLRSKTGVLRPPPSLSLCPLSTSPPQPPRRLPCQPCTGSCKGNKTRHNHRTTSETENAASFFARGEAGLG